MGEGYDGQVKVVTHPSFFPGEPWPSLGERAQGVLREAMCAREDCHTQPQSGTGCLMTSLPEMSAHSLRSRQTWRKLQVKRSFGNEKAMYPERKCEFT